MPKNVKGGNKAKSQKNSSGQEKKREVATPEEEDDSHIAIITKVHGDSRYLCQIVDQNGIQPKVYPTTMSKGTKNKYGRGTIVGVGTYVLISIREFQKDKSDIIFVYRDSEIQYLVDNNYLKITQIDNDNADDDIQFVDDLGNDNSDKIFEQI